MKENFNFVILSQLTIFSSNWIEQARSISKVPTQTSPLKVQIEKLFVDEKREIFIFQCDFSRVDWKLHCISYRMCQRKERYRQLVISNTDERADNLWENEQSLKACATLFQSESECNASEMVRYVWTEASKLSDDDNNIKSSLLIHFIFTLFNLAIKGVSALLWKVSPLKVYVMWENFHSLTQLCSLYESSVAQCEAERVKRYAQNLIVVLNDDYDNQL